MLRLLKLAAYSLLGYAMYEFIRGATGGDVKGAFQGVRDKIEGSANQLGQRARHMVEAASEPMSEAGGEGGGQREGGQRQRGRGNPGNGRNQGSQRVSTQDADGGSVTHQVGRGVVL
jgi:hypothetical protein